jgi:hypothetical protein
MNRLLILIGFLILMPAARAEVITVPTESVSNVKYVLPDVPNHSWRLVKTSDPKGGLLTKFTAHVKALFTKKPKVVAPAPITTTQGVPLK